VVPRHNGGLDWSFIQFDEKYTDRVTDLANRSMSETYNEKVILDIYRSWREGFILLMAGDEIAGFICGSRYSITEARILLLAVENAYRRSGLGSMLLDRFLEICRKSGYLSVRLEVRTDNDGAISFYRRHGFSITSTMLYYYSDLSDAFQMWRML
jgi:ribosomal-protein-alanine N-acetyltransferase